MAKLYNLARMTTATVGTGTITLSSAVSGYLTFALAGTANGDIVSYGIKDGANSEVGTGTYTSAGTTLTRTVTVSTNSNTAISLSGTAEVYITARAEDLAIAANNGPFTLGNGLTNVASDLRVSLSTFTNSLGADVALNNNANYFDGPSVAQGSTGTWFATGTVTVTSTGTQSNIDAKLWDGTTVIASSRVLVLTASLTGGFSIALSGYLASPAGNLRISCRSENSTTGVILFNSSGNSKDSTISAFRIQ